MGAAHPFTPDLFRRVDESDDAVFYALPRKVVHIDPGAISALSRFYDEILPRPGRILDLMSSWRSHIPVEGGGSRRQAREIVGLGMNAEEMEDNPALSSFVVHDLNQDQRLPFLDRSMDGAVLTVSLQYLVEPIEVFRDVARLLRPEAPFVVVVSHRCFPTKAVEIWNRCRTMRERMELAMGYLSHAGGFCDLSGIDLRPGVQPGEDPVAAVSGRKAGKTERSGMMTTGWRKR